MRVFAVHAPATVVLSGHGIVLWRLNIIITTENIVLKSSSVSKRVHQCSVFCLAMIANS